MYIAFDCDTLWLGLVLNFAYYSSDTSTALHFNNLPDWLIDALCWRFYFMYNVWIKYVIIIRYGLFKIM